MALFLDTFFYEFDYFFLPCLRLNKYKYVQDWFEEKKKEALAMDLQILPLMIIRVTQHLRMKMNLQMSIMIAY